MKDMPIDGDKVEYHRVRQRKSRKYLAEAAAYSYSQIAQIEERQHGREGAARTGRLGHCQVNLTSRRVPSIVSSVLDFSLQEGQLVQAHNQTGGYQDAIKATVLLALWTLAWAATLALAKFGPGLLWDSQQPVASWAAVAANLVVGIGWIVAHARYLRELDELQRKIMQDALAVTLGVGWVSGFAYVVADAAGLVAYDVDIGALAALLSVVYMIAIAVGNIRYR